MLDGTVVNNTHPTAVQGCLVKVCQVRECQLKAMVRCLAALAGTDADSQLKAVECIKASLLRDTVTDIKATRDEWPYLTPLHTSHTSFKYSDFRHGRRQVED